MHETNLKPTLYWCPKCKEDTITDRPNPKCSKDNETLIKVMFSIMDQTRITGVK